MTTNEPIEPAELAAFLDGRLTEPERQRVIRQINDSDESFELLTQVAAELYSQDGADVSGGGAPAASPAVSKSPPSVRHWSPRLTQPRNIAIAAGLAAVVAGLGLGLGLGTKTPDLTRPAPMWVAAVDEQQLMERLEPGWDRPSWSVLRGEVPRADADLSFRVGVRLVDLHTAWVLGDTAVARRVFGELDALLEQVPGAQVLASQYRSLREQFENGVPVDSLRDRAARLEPNLPVDDTAFALAKWVETARLAALAADTAFFNSALVRDVVELLTSTPTDPPIGDRLRDLRALLGDGADAGDMVAVVEHTREIIRRHGG